MRFDIYYLFVIFAVLSVVGNFLCASAILQKGYLSISSRLALYLHITEILLDIGAFPYQYFIATKFPRGCAFIAFLQAYAGLSNSLAILGMSIFAHETLFGTTLITTMSHEVWMSILIFFPPFLMLLGYCQPNVYGLDREFWCFFSANNNFGNYFAVGLFYDVIFGIICIVIVIFANIMWKFRSFPTIQFKVLRFLGMYSAVNLSFWLLRAILRINSQLSGNELSAFVSYLLSFVGGVCSVVVFVIERKALSDSEDAIACMRASNYSIDTVGSKRSSFEIISSLHAIFRGASASTRLLRSLSGRWWIRPSDTSEDGPKDTRGSDGGVLTASRPLSMQTALRPPSLQMTGLASPTPQHGFAAQSMELFSITEEPERISRCESKSVTDNEVGSFHLSMTASVDAAAACPTITPLHNTLLNTSRLHHDA